MAIFNLDYNEGARTKYVDEHLKKAEELKKMSQDTRAPEDYRRYKRELADAEKAKAAKYSSIDLDGTTATNPHRIIDKHTSLSSDKKFRPTTSEYRKLYLSKKGKEDFNRDFGSAKPKNKALHASINSKQEVPSGPKAIKRLGADGARRVANTYHRGNQDNIKRYAKNKLMATKEAFENFFCEESIFDSAPEETFDSILNNAAKTTLSTQLAGKSNCITTPTENAKFTNEMFFSMPSKYANYDEYMKNKLLKRAKEKDRDIYDQLPKEWTDDQKAEYLYNVFKNTK